MIKVLIVSNGLRFRIKKKTLFGYMFMTFWIGSEYKKFGEYSTFEEALNYLKEEYGNQFKLMNSEIYVPTPITCLY